MIYCSLLKLHIGEARWAFRASRMRLGQRSPQPRPRPLRPGAGVALPLGSTRCSVPSSCVAFLLTASHPNLQVQRGPPLPRACAGHLAGLACRVATCATPVLLVPTRYHVKLPWSGPLAHCLPQENAHPPGARAPCSLMVPSARPGTRHRVRAPWVSAERIEWTQKSSVPARPGHLPLRAPAFTAQ